MNADELKKVTTEALNQLSAALEQGHSEILTALCQRDVTFGSTSCRARPYRPPRRVVPASRASVSHLM